jgi:hypothetical protein
MQRFQRNRLESVSVLCPNRSSFGWRLSASAMTVTLVISVCAVLIGLEEFNRPADFVARHGALADLQPMDLHS